MNKAKRLLRLNQNEAQSMAKAGIIFGLVAAIPYWVIVAAMQ